jgi:hypothetical protein
MKSRLPISTSDLKAAVNKLEISNHQQQWVIKSLKLVLKEVWKQKHRQNLVPYPDFQARWYVKEIIVGGVWQYQKRQRRRKAITFPSRGSGAPKRQYAEYLMLRLGELYVRATGNSPTRGGTSGNYSKFEKFASPFFIALNIDDFRNRVRKYIKDRKSGGN